MRWLAAIAAASGCACGRIDFEGRLADAAVDAIDAPVLAPHVVAVTTMKDSNGVATLTMAIPPVAAGDLLVAGFTIHSNAAVLRIVDGNGRDFTSANARGAMGMTASEIWYLADAAPSAEVVITMNGSTGFDVWIAEFANVAAVPFDTSAHACAPYPPSIVTAPVATTRADELVFGATMLSAPGVVKAVAAPFVGLLVQNGNGAAYYVPPAAGSYGPDWTLQSGSAFVSCASTASFLPR